MEECQSSPIIVVHDVEEGEISDSASSVEEITEEAFNNDHKEPQPPPAPSAAPPTPSVALLNSNSANVNDINNNNNLNKQQQRVWTMTDLYKYQLSRNYSAGLYNLAWASAVQNKPLDEVLVMEFNKAENNGGKRSSSGGGSEVPIASVDSNKAALGEGGDTSATAVENADVNSEVIEVSGEGKGEMEEGELEEGEIDFDSDMVNESNGDLSYEEKEDKRQSDLGTTVDLIREGLESVTTEEAEKSLDEVSSRIQNMLDSVEEMTEKSLLAAKDVIAPHAFSAIKIVNTVFSSMNRAQNECNKEMMLRLLAHASNLKCCLFSDQQLKEIELMVSALDSSFMYFDSKEAFENKYMKEVEVLAKSDLDFSSGIVKKFPKGITDLDIDLVEASEPQTSQEDIKLANSKWRGLSLPLLDLHKDHDADSLPSPTRGSGPSCLPSEKGLAVGFGLLKPEWPVPRAVLNRENVPMHPYETDAVKAVSSYQQKFGRSSFLMNDRLPSPTPSEEGDTGDGDISGEVSSSSNSNVNPVNTVMVGLTTTSYAPMMNIPSGQGLINSWNSSHSSYGPNPSLKSSSAKSRDPRLRLANADASTSNCLMPVVNPEHKVDPVGVMINSRKQKTDDNLVFDGPAFKRQRAEQTEITNEGQVLAGTGGWLEDRGVGGLGAMNKSHEMKISDPSRRAEFVVAGVSSSSSIPNMTVNSTVNLPVTTPNATASLQSLLKDIAVNPTIWMNILKLEQQKSANPSQTATQPMVLNPSTGAVPSTNVVASKSPGLGDKAAGIIQMTPQISSGEELGKVRMKPRDPRRILHTSTVQKAGNMELNQSLTKTSTSSTPGVMGNMNVQKLDGLLDKKSMPSAIAPPDITRQFTKNLKNIADIVSVSQATSSPSVVPKNTSSPLVQAHQGRTDAVTVLESGSLQNMPGRDGKVSSGPSQPHDWNDVEHLFEGYDDQQKAAIHRERARRLEEQRKMFAGRKLCLVLDLDHTLLNSAKFSEVDPVHDEMLRKKEELDREKSHRHLFRFPHMGMWTKLRPGIWNFLEKASKLFELHLYTMGNKLYATEMAKLLDPKGELFAGRVISRGDDGDLLDGDERVPKIKDLEGVMGMESSVIIIDDSVRVWPHNKLNLIVVERYIYFPCSRRQFGLPGPSLLEIDHDERPEDGTLASSLAVIERIHQIFFAHQSLDEVDVRNILASEQRKILAGCRVLFSRVFPVGEANPHLHPLWQTAEQFGAVCTNFIDEKVTHVVANSLGTDKVNWALSTGRFVVHPGWVEASALLYRRANEVDFAIKP